MTYHFSKTVYLSMDAAVAKVTDALKQEGFGILTEIDVQKTLKTKIDVDFRPYRILGACNPGFAHKALLAEDKIGTMLPCNVIVQETSPGTVRSVGSRSGGVDEGDHQSRPRQNCRRGAIEIAARNSATVKGGLPSMTR